MLTYHPAFDLYNCIFRMLCLLSHTKEDDINLEKLKIWDFYLTFPRQVRDIRFPSELRQLKERIFKFSDNPYEKLPDPKRIFERMNGYQLSALKCLASYGFIDSQALLKNRVLKNKKDIPEDLLKEINNLPAEKKNVIKLIVNDFIELPLYGDKGLKARTGLIEYRYDQRN